MEKKYKVVLRSDSALRIKENGGTINLDFNLHDIKANCFFSDIVEVHDGIKIHRHMQVEVDIIEKDINIAIEKAERFSDFLLANASFSSNALVSTPKVHIAYDITPELSERELVQYFYDIELPQKAKRNIEFFNFDLLLKKQMKYKRSDRISRAIRWYRKYLSEEDILDRFNYLWVALESLNPLLSRKYNLHAMIQRCPECKYEREVPSAIGIKHIFHSYFKNSENLYNEVNDTRVGLVHSTKNISKLAENAERLITDMERAVRKSILLLLEIDFNKNKNWFIEPLTNIPRVYAKVACTIIEPDPDQLINKGQHPHFKYEGIIIKRKKEPNGKLTCDFEIKLTKIFKAEYRKQYVDFYSPEGIKVDIKSI